MSGPSRVPLLSRAAVSMFSIASGSCVAEKQHHREIFRAARRRFHAYRRNGAAGMNACARVSFRANCIRSRSVFFRSSSSGGPAAAPAALRAGTVADVADQAPRNSRSIERYRDAAVFPRPRSHAIGQSERARLFGAVVCAVLAVVFLHERMPLRRLAALLAGVAGVLIVLRPGLERSISVRDSYWRPAHLGPDADRHQGAVAEHSSLTTTIMSGYSRPRSR